MMVSIIEKQNLRINFVLTDCENRQDHLKKTVLTLNLSYNGKIHICPRGSFCDYFDADHWVARLLGLDVKIPARSLPVLIREGPAYGIHSEGFVHDGDSWTIEDIKSFLDFQTGSRSFESLSSDPGRNPYSPFPWKDFGINSRLAKLIRISFDSPDGQSIFENLRNGGIRVEESASQTLDILPEYIMEEDDTWGRSAPVEDDAFEDFEGHYMEQGSTILAKTEVDESVASICSIDDLPSVDVSLEKDFPEGPPSNIRSVRRLKIRRRSGLMMAQSNRELGTASGKFLSGHYSQGHWSLGYEPPNDPWEAY